jgi:acetyl-CoA carboxylase beta subunit
MKYCKHLKAQQDWSHTDSLVYCPDCGEELTEEEIEDVYSRCIDCGKYTGGGRCNKCSKI